MPTSKASKTSAKKGSFSKIYDTAKGVVTDVWSGAATGSIWGAGEAVSKDIALKRIGSKTTAKKSASKQASTTKSKPAAKKKAAKTTAGAKGVKKH